MLTHFIAFCAGGFFGIVVMCMCFAAGEEDRRIGEPRPRRVVSHPEDGIIHSESCESHEGSACVPQQSYGTNSDCYDDKEGRD
ncbi:MAG: DUF3789 domain-containing protein [Lachnospiraceae bacterium]|nr:DUF3789 domain-containing protein [Lachnospiraceae bacterium]